MDPKEPTRRRFLATGGIGAAAVAARAEAAAAPAAGKPGKRPLTLGLTTYMVLHYDLDQTIAMAQRVAVQPICIRSNLLPLTSTPRQIEAAHARLKEAGLTVYGGGVIYMRNEQQVHRAFEHARAAGYALLSIAIRPDLLPLLERKVREFDIRACIHNHGPGDPWPHPVAIHEKIKGLDSRIGICHDTGHTMRTGMDPTGALLKTADRHMDVHLKDVDAPTRKGRSVELGRGIVDLPSFLRALVEVGYQGVVGIEYEKHMKDLLPGLAESVGYARGVLDAMG
ncbi:MAG: sugar phosphate isomerase/epimerase family protein [Planctomycetota bacterium]